MTAAWLKISIYSALSFAVLATYSGSANGQSADAVLCDRLAAYPSDPDKPADIKGVLSIAPGDIETAIKFCKQAKGSRRFSFQLGRAYEANGDTQAAIAAYRKASGQGSASAMSRLASLDKAGAQSGETRKMFERAAQGGDPVALNNMGMAYATGDGVPLDYTKARSLFQQAADGNNADAMFQLGMMTEQGDGGPKDDAAARALYEKAAARDQIGALERAGDFALAGRGGPKDEAAAKRYYEKAAALGSDDAKAALNRMKCPYTIKAKNGQRVTDLCF
ncbi:tetratricopeptide repeat protein [uncultured Methylovirgula sp.]|uniref:tetratricopeptide repeat protein n=1 Tax=uncultured Methylovirgula sp. TaxID=1285960 RepID=UPI00260403D9|nr:tetratricopeptide repeat protein [uncultured Methylovirgula sp.]